jgi:hypothetical protein
MQNDAYIAALETELDHAVRGGKHADRIATIKKELARAKGGKVETAESDPAETVAPRRGRKAE